MVCTIKLKRIVLLPLGLLYFSRAIKPIDTIFIHSIMLRHDDEIRGGRITAGYAILIRKHFTIFALIYLAGFHKL